MSASFQPMETAPVAGPVELITAGGHIVRATLTTVVGDDGDCAAWITLEDGEHPPCWTDGICWAKNADGEPSDPPVGWRPIEGDTP